MSTKFGPFSSSLNRSPDLSSCITGQDITGQHYFFALAKLYIGSSKWKGGIQKEQLLLALFLVHVLRYYMSILLLGSQLTKVYRKRWMEGWYLKGAVTTSPTLQICRSYIKISQDNIAPPRYRKQWMEGKRSSYYQSLLLANFWPPLLATTFQGIGSSGWKGGI